MPASKDLLEGFRALNEATAAYRLAATYFSGTPLEQFANQHIERLVQGSGPYRFRLAHRPVNAMTSRVRIAAVTSDREEATARIDKIRTANDMVRLEPLIHRKTFMYGDAYVMCWPVLSTDDAPESLQVGPESTAPVDQELRAAGVEISYQSPLGTRVIYEGEDGRRPRFAIRRWQEKWLGGDVWRAELWYPGDPAYVEDWVTLPGSAGGSEDDWVPYAQDEAKRQVPVGPGTWPVFHDWDLPIKHARTDMPYGVPEHIDAYGPQDAINKLLITQVSSIEAYGWPDRYSLVDDMAVLDQAREAVAWDDDADAPAASTGRRRTRPGAGSGGGQEHRYTGTKAVGEFSQPDPNAMTGPVDQYVRLMAAATGTALSEFDPSEKAILSGAAQRAADKPQRDRELDRKLYLEGFWREVWTTALNMDGTDPGTITVQWAPGEVNTDPDWWATAQLRLTMGVPLRQILMEANYLPDEVDKWLDQVGNEEAALDQRIARLNTLGVALQGIGTAQALGVVSAEQVSALVNQIMGQAGAPEGTPQEITPPEPDVPGDNDADDEQDPEGDR